MEKIPLLILALCAGAFFLHAQEAEVSVPFTGKADSSKVVTALGIPREASSLGYLLQEINGSALNFLHESNFSASLSGKAPGMRISHSNTMGGSNNILIRGYSSLQGNNQPLFVIDGVPMDNSNYSTGADGWGGYDYGNIAQDLHSFDIKSISILKGVAASALYGSHGANGVILLTTKRGEARKGIGVNVYSGFMMGSIDKTTLPHHQYSYGAGYGPFYNDASGYFHETDLNGNGTLELVVPTSEDASWGHKFDTNLEVVHWWALDPGDKRFAEKEPWTSPAEDDRMPAFFLTGKRWVNSIAFDGGNTRGNFRLSYTNQRETGIVPNSKLYRHHVSFSGSYDIMKRLNVSTYLVYNHQSTTGRMGTGYDNQNIMNSLGKWFQTNVGFEEMKRFETPDGNQRTWNYSSYDNLTPIFRDNPYWVRYKNFNDDHRNRVFGYISASYTFVDWLSLTLRSAIDTYEDVQNERIAMGSVASSGFTTREKNVMDSHTDLFLKLDKGYGEFSLAGMLGGQYRIRNFQASSMSTVGGLEIPDLYTILNSVSPFSTSMLERKQIEKSLYTSFSVGYKNIFYVEGTGRVEPVSYAIEAPYEQSGVCFYPSVSGSFLMHNLGGIKDLAWIDYLKLLMNYGRTGFEYPGDGFNKGVELGLEAYVLENRIGIDLAVYQNLSYNQLFNANVTAGTGFRTMIIKGGEMENKGVEMALHLVPLNLKGFQWNIDLNWYSNRNTVLSLPDGVNGLLLMSAWDVKISVLEGQPFGTIQGSDYIYAIGLNSQGDPLEALSFLKNALERHPYDRNILYSLATISMENGSYTEARAYAEKLVENYPLDASYQQLMGVLTN